MSFYTKHIFPFGTVIFKFPRNILLSGILFCAINVFGASTAETIIVGEIYDKQNNTPIENAHIYFKKTQIGATSNAEGFFMLRTQEHHSGVLIVSALGYKQQQYKISIGQYAGVQIELEEENTLLQDIFILPGSNPALPLIEKVRINRAQNDVRNQPQLVTNTTERTHLFISDISQKSLQRKVWKSLQAGSIQAEDSTWLIPLYTTEKKYQLQGDDKTLQQTANEQATALPETNLNILTDGLTENFDFYQNTVNVLGKNFISPLAGTGNSYYQYFLADSTQSMRGKKYIIHFKSKNVRNAAFEGTFSIDSATYALQDIEVSVPDKSNVNFLSSLRIRQKYSEEPNSPFTLQSEDVSLLLDFAVSLDSTHYFPTILALKNTQADNAPQTAVATQNIVSDSLVMVAMDSLNNTPLIKFARWAAQTIFTGYAPAGYIEIGKVIQLISMNSVEQVRLGIPLRTSEKLMKNLCFEGYGGYGFGDKAWKYMAQVQYRFPTDMRHQINANYSNDYIRMETSNFDMLLRENTIGRGYMDFATSILGLAREHTLSRREEARIWLNNDWTDNFETELNLRAGHMHYGQLINFYNQPYFRYNSVSLVGRWSWNERIVDSFFKRTYIYNHLPVVYANVEAGNYRMTETEQYRYYGKLNIMVRQNIYAGMMGKIDYLVQGGIILGDVPYPLLQIMHGNETWGFDRYKFSLMDNLEFAADKYIVLHTTWDMEGILFNQIPGIKYLNLHEIISFKAAYGSMKSSHNQVLALPEGTSSFTQPYVEVGVGIGNILRVINVQSIWRLTERNKPGANLWGVKFQLKLGL